MAFTFTPTQIARRGSFYHQLSTLIGAGVGLVRGLDTVRSGRESASFNKSIDELSARLQSGQTFSQAIATSQGWVPEFDLALIQAGEQSGRLDSTLRLLGQYYDERARMIRRLIFSLLYPFLTIHVAIMVFPISALTNLVQTMDVPAFLVPKLLLMLAIYTGIFLVVFAAQGSRGQVWRAMLERICHYVPVFGSARRSLAIARLSAALEALVNAGVNIVEAWGIAAKASGSPALVRMVESWKPRLQMGATPAELVSQSPWFPSAFANIYHTGEISGQLDQSLLRLHATYQEEASRKMMMAMMLFAGAVLGAVLIMGAWYVISFYIGYYNSIMDVF